MAPLFRAIIGLGKMVVVGMGGIYVEVFKDIAARFIPLTITAAKAMIQELQSAPILNGTRGKEGINIDALAKLLVALSQLAEEHPEIQELDINPLVATAEGQFLALDARIRVQPTSQKTAV